jgi:hypothetical protein
MKNSGMKTELQIRDDGFLNRKRVGRWGFHLTFPAGAAKNPAPD